MEILNIRRNLVFELLGSVQNYAWGKTGKNSEVAQLIKNGSPNIEIKADQPYAELWMGTHPSGPSVIVKPEVQPSNLRDWIHCHPDSLGSKIREQFGDDLPFLFKVLSVNKALSIQAHPNKAHAEELHKKFPDIYKDPNHKPEMAFALTPFEALCGFRLVSEVQKFITEIPELQAVIGEENIEYLEKVNSKDEAQVALKKCFSSMMKCPPHILKQTLNNLVKKFSSTEHEKSEQLQQLFLNLHSEFPGDVGCLGIFFFNYIKLKPGDAIFLAANEPHAYLYGDCVECMACSDNVVRAGLTPKYKDVATLCDMLTYESGDAEDVLFEGSPVDEFTTAYSPPVPDFAVSKTELPARIKNYVLPLLQSASIAIIIQGEAEAFTKAENCEEKFSWRRGCIFFIPANETVELTIKSEGMLIFRAYCNL